MHETARHIIHSTEMLETAISVMESVLKQARICPPQGYDLACSRILNDLEFCTSLLIGFRNRSQALEKRLDNEISLVSLMCSGSEAQLTADS